MKLAKQEQLAKFLPFLKTSVFLTLEATLNHYHIWTNISQITLKSDKHFQAFLVNKVYENI